MARTSIDHIVALHRKLVMGMHERRDESLAHIASTIEALGTEERDALRGRLRSRLETLRAERDRVVSDFEFRARGLEAELARLEENADLPAPDAEPPPEPERSDASDTEPPRSRRPTRTRTGARKRGRGET